MLRISTTSVLSAELLAILQASKLSGTAKLKKILILPGSLQAIKDHINKAPVNYLAARAQDEMGNPRLEKVLTP